MGIIRQQSKSSQMSLLLDAQMANATAQLRANNLDGAKRTADALGQLYPAEWGATPAASPLPSIAPTPTGHSEVARRRCRRACLFSCCVRAKTLEQV